VDHFGAGADDAAPLGIFADHEAVDVVQENQRDAVLVAVHDEACGLFGGFSVDDAAELDAFLIGTARKRGDVLFLIGDDADGPAANARVSAQNGLAVFGAVFLELAGVDDTGDDFAHVILLAGIVGKGAIDFACGIKRLARS